jgi:hypothetical protein
MEVAEVAQRQVRAVQAEHASKNSAPAGEREAVEVAP